MPIRRDARGQRRTLALLVPATLVVVVALAFLPPDTRGIVSRPNPARDYEEALARVADLEARDTDGVRVDCRTSFKGQVARTGRAIVLFHGLTNCPRQFERLGVMLHDRGYNVLISRLPRHGLADRMTAALGGLRAEEVAAHADRVVDAAAGLGRSVTVVGLSLGGNAAAWVAQERPEVERAIIIAPGLGLPAFPGWMSSFAVHYLADTPNRFHWWDGAARERLAGPPQVYPRFSTRALGEMLKLGCAVRERARSRASAAREVLLVMVGGDKAVDNGLVRALGRDWRAHGGRVEEYEFPAALGLNHDLIDPDQVGARTDLVYPKLLEWIDAEVLSVEPGRRSELVK